MRFFLAKTLFGEFSVTEATRFLRTGRGPELQTPEAALLALVEPAGSFAFAHLGRLGIASDLKKRSECQGNYSELGRDYSHI